MHDLARTLGALLCVAENRDGYLAAAQGSDHLGDAGHRRLDHRFVDGYQAATMSRVFRSYLADPAAQDPIPPARKGGPRNRRPATGIRGN